MENTDRADLFLCKVKKRQITASGNYRSKGGDVLDLTLVFTLR